jgi:hypothetical protein
LNDNNNLTNQEKINGILGIVSERIREISRLGNLYTKLKVLEVIGLKPNGRMNIDEIVARACLYESWHQSKKDTGIYFAYASDAETSKTCICLNLIVTTKKHLNPLFKK